MPRMIEKHWLVSVWVPADDLDPGLRGNLEGVSHGRHQQRNLRAVVNVFSTTPTPEGARLTIDDISADVAATIRQRGAVNGVDNSPVVVPRIDRR